VRLTVDLDLMLDLCEENLERFVKVMEKLGYKPMQPVDAREIILKEKRDEWKKEKGALVLTFFNPEKPYKQVDFFLENIVDFDTAFGRKNVLNVGGVNIYLASIDDLINIKARTGRPRDIEDIIHLERIKKLK